jgi:hypothetical protein
VRKPYVDSAYFHYVKHERKPWCDVCEKPVVFSEGWGWYHLDSRQKHEVSLNGYHVGCEAEIIKRLKFEI